MQAFHEWLKWLDGSIGGSAWFVYLLLGTGVFFTLYLKFPQLRYFRHALRIVMGKYDREGDEGDTSHFQALATALSGTVGTGNIAGVAFAIHLGGPAALFWMLVTAFLGMTTKFVEVTLSHKYREKADDGSMAGGPMYFMNNKLKMPWLAAIFAVATVISAFGTGNMPQINSIANSMHATFGINKMLLGGLLAVLLGVVIIGGIKRIAKVTEKLVPAMALIYIIGALGVIVYNAGNLLPAIASVFTDVFSGTAAAGGFLGATFAYAFNRGVNRGLFSNEAGQGSAPIAHASARAHEPVSEGMVAILEPFIDTIVICSLTGMVLLSSGVWNEKIEQDFQLSELYVLQGQYNDQAEQDREALAGYLLHGEDIAMYGGELVVEEGKISSDVTLLHARSIAEDVAVIGAEGQLFSGKIPVNEGVADISELVDIRFRGKSLQHSAPLTAEAFGRSIFGGFGSYIVTFGLLLFAFSTAISWSYYGDRAMTYLFGTKGIVYYRIVYVLAFFLAAFMDTALIWTLSGIAIAMMTIPNLVGIIMLHKDMKNTIAEYWDNFKKEHPKG